MSEKTISQNLALYAISYKRRMQQIRRELRAARRRYYWLRLKGTLARLRRKERNSAYYVIYL
jgi:hypothetical protein